MISVGIAIFKIYAILCIFRNCALGSSWSYILIMFKQANCAECIISVRKNSMSWNAKYLFGKSSYVQIHA